MRIFIAGPMRGKPKFNFPLFDAAEGTLVERGHEPVNPAALDRADGFAEDRTVLPDDFWEKVWHRNTQAIRRCDCLAVLPGWEKSEGARAEVAYARTLGHVIRWVATLQSVPADELAQAIPTSVDRIVTTQETSTDDGGTETFATGAVRGSQRGKPRLDLISPVFLERLGNVMRLGTDDYECRNWEKGIPINRSLASLLRHINAYRNGCGDEDHLALAACNLMFLIHTEEMIDREVLPRWLDDLPDYQPEEAV